MLRVAGKTETDKDVEDKVRKALGLQVCDKLGKTLGFPIHTEWVFTSQPYVDRIKEMIGEKVSLDEECTTELLLQSSFDLRKVNQKKHPIKKLQMGIHVCIREGKDGSFVEEQIKVKQEAQCATGSDKKLKKS